MADNFLERRMEDLASGKLARNARKPYHRKESHKPAAGVVLILDGLSDEGKAAVRRYSSVGWKVTFLGRDFRRGNLLAQQTATQYVHITGSVDDAKRRAEELRGSAFDLIL